MKEVRLRKPTIGAFIVIVVGALCALVATSRGLLVVQSVVGSSETFSIGQATLSRSDGWLLLDYRARRGDPHMKLGFIASRESGGLPEGRYYSFEDIDRPGRVTFIEIDDDTAARLVRTDFMGLDCRRVADIVSRRLVQCLYDKQQVLVYDLDRAFVAGVSPVEGPLLDRVLAVMK